MPPNPQRDVGVLPYANAALVPGVDAVQVFRDGTEMRRVVVPTGVSFEVTPYAFRLAAAGTIGIHTETWPRSAVAGVHVNRFSDRLVIELPGRDPVEVDVGPDRASAERVMHEVIASLTVIPAAPAHLQMLDDRAGRLPPSSVERSALLWLSAGLFAAGLAWSLLVSPVGLCLCAAAAVPVGIVFGTRQSAR